MKTFIFTIMAIITTACGTQEDPRFIGGQISYYTGKFTDNAGNDLTIDRETFKVTSTSCDLQAQILRPPLTDGKVTMVVKASNNNLGCYPGYSHECQFVVQTPIDYNHLEFNCDGVTKTLARVQN